MRLLNYDSIQETKHFLDAHKRICWEENYHKHTWEDKRKRPKDNLMLF